jgi:hypothetical protein
LDETKAVMREAIDNLGILDVVEVLKEAYDKEEQAEIAAQLES